MDYDVEGRLIARLFRNPDGTVWATRYSYGAAGKLLRVSEGRVGDPAVDSVYAYDEQGRLASIDDGIKPPITFAYNTTENEKAGRSRGGLPGKCCHVGLSFSGGRQAPQPTRWRNSQYNLQ